MSASQHLLLYEPRVEGHHLVWLKFITEDLLSAGYSLTLALDTRPASYERVRQRLGPLLEKVTVLAVHDQSGQKIGGNGARSVANCLDRSGAPRVFLNTLDEIASPLLRGAALGQLPPGSLRGKMGGIYVRPRFLVRRGFSPNEWLKYLGFSRLIRGEWFGQILFLDPWINETCREWFPQAPVFALPDPCPDNFTAAAEPARHHFGIPADKNVFLFYGGAYRRKGLHLAVEAFQRLPGNGTAFLLCAGQQPDDERVRRGLEALVHEGRALVISRYIFEEEEKLLFAASDVVLLPYIKHFGNSAVLSRAAGAGKMVIASDEELVGRLVHEYQLGLLFSTGDAGALSMGIQQATSLTVDEKMKFNTAAHQYGSRCSREAFRQTLLNSLQIFN
jgi:glycosyltransferase involved in cell wall biosynthesis